MSQLRYALRARNTRSVAAADGELRSLLRRRDALLRELRRRGLDFSNEVPGEPNARVESEQTQAPQQQYSAAEQSTLVELAVKVENLLQALATRTVIGQAEGILIERHKLTTEAAFAMLAHASQVTNRKVRDIAADLVRTGELAGPR